MAAGACSLHRGAARGWVRAFGRESLRCRYNARLDIATDPEVEPTIELIIARRVEKLEGNYAASKNACKLHLSYQYQGVELVEVERDESDNIEDS